MDESGLSSFYVAATLNKESALEVPSAIPKQPGLVFSQINTIPNQYYTRTIRTWAYCPLFLFETLQQCHLDVTVFDAPAMYCN